MISLITPFSSDVWCATVSRASGITQLASHLAAAEGHGRVKCNGRQARRHIKSKPTTIIRWPRIAHAQHGQHCLRQLPVVDLATVARAPHNQAAARPESK